jgi:Protein of unknown function (DUF998)
MQFLTTQRSTSMPQLAAGLAIVAVVAYQALLILLIFLRPDLDPSWHTISEWAIGHYGWVMSDAFLLSGISYAALTLALWSHLRGITGILGRCFLVICALSAVGVGLFTTDPMPFHAPLTGRGTLHVICGSGQLVLFPFAALFASLSLARSMSAAWTTVRNKLLALAGLPLLGFLGFVTYTALFVLPLGPSAYGPGVNIGWPPRIAFLAYAIWLVTVAALATRFHRRRRSYVPESRNTA